MLATKKLQSWYQYVMVELQHEFSMVLFTSQQLLCSAACFNNLGQLSTTGNDTMPKRSIGSLQDVQGHTAD